jgi:hypothetical protein
LLEWYQFCLFMNHKPMVAAICHFLPPWSACS